MTDPIPTLKADVTKVETFITKAKAAIVKYGPYLAALIVGALAGKFL